MATTLVAPHYRYHATAIARESAGGAAWVVLHWAYHSYAVEVVEQMPDDLMIGVQEELDLVILQVYGCLSLRNTSQVRQVTIKSLLSSGRVLIDLSNLRSAQPAFVTVFPTALSTAGGWPSARLVLFGADAAMRSMLLSARITDTVPLATDVVSARALLEQWPRQVRRHCDLPMHTAAPATARRFVRETCSLWSVPRAIQEVAELVSNELVSNAVEHAHSSSRLTVTRTGPALRVSVQDHNLSPVPRTRPIDIEASRGRGLHLVAALAKTWGVNHGPDGKTIWANLQLDSPE